LIGFLNGVYMLGAVFVTCIKALVRRKTSAVSHYSY
jgi:hypothetical protein